MKFLKELLNYFAYITAGTTIAFVIFTTVTKVDIVPIKMVAEIPLAGFVIAFITTVILYKEQKTKKAIIITAVLHFITVSAAMIILGLLFEWIRFQFIQIFIMFICIVFVWGFTFLFQYLTSKKDAKDLSRAISEKYNLSANVPRI